MRYQVSRQPYPFDRAGRRPRAGRHTAFAKPIAHALSNPAYANRVTIPAFPAPDVLAAREKLVLDHFHDEVRHAWDDVLSTFPHPRYELIP